MLIFFPIFRISQQVLHGLQEVTADCDCSGLKEVAQGNFFFQLAQQLLNFLRFLFFSSHLLPLFLKSI